MREILFRGKRKDNGEWIQGDLLHDRFISSNEKICRIYNEESKLTHREDVVIPETVGQYTGLKDKNGKRIFEGDIILHHSDNIYAIPANAEKGLVYWDDMCCGWRRTSNGVLHNNVVKTYRMSNECDYEIIGNIHDNPELLEVTWKN